MGNEQYAQLSNTLFNVAFISYIAAMVLYFFRLAFTRVSVAGELASTRAGTRVGQVATALACAGWVVHLASYVARGLAAGRLPWANMYEYSSGMALIVVAVGLVVVQRRFGYGHLMGFVLAASVLMMTSALLLFTPPGPVVPALRSYWIRIHTSAMMGSSAVLIVGFAMTALYLVKDAGERRVALRSGAGYTGSTVGAAHLPGLRRRSGEAPEAGEGPAAGSGHGEAAADTSDAVLPATEGRIEGDAVDTATISPAPDDEDDAFVSHLAQREALSPRLFPLVPGVVVAAFTLWVWGAPVAALIAGSVAAVVGVATWYAVPYLPPAARLDSLAYRTIAFAFPILTFGVLAGAIWAEEAWGRYWGWDPKETGSFFTWVLYAAYLHARSTRGWRGRRAAWIGVVAFAALMVTYYAVNLFVVGLHSYAGV